MEPFLQEIFKDVYLVDLTPEDMNVKFISGYIIHDEENIIVVEQGPKSTVNRLIESLKKIGYTDERLHLFVTHIHLDHSGAAGTLLNNFLNSQAYVHPRAIKHMLNPEKLWKGSLNALGWVAELYQRPDPAPGHRIRVTNDEEEIDVGRYRFKFIYTEGHASHHQSIYWIDYNAMFVGDAAGIYIRELDYVVPTTLYPFKYQLYIESLKKMIEYRPEYLFYPHYGVVENGVQRLRDHLRQVENWFRIARDLDVKEKNFFVARLRKEDREFSELYEKAEDYPVLKLLLEFAFMGILSEAEKH